MKIYFFKIYYCETFLQKKIYPLNIFHVKILPMLLSEKFVLLTKVFITNQLTLVIKNTNVSLLSGPHILTVSQLIYRIQIHIYSMVLYSLNYHQKYY